MGCRSVVRKALSLLEFKARSKVKPDSTYAEYTLGRSQFIISSSQWDRPLLTTLHLALCSTLSGPIASEYLDRRRRDAIDECRLKGPPSGVRRFPQDYSGLLTTFAAGQARRRRGAPMVERALKRCDGQTRWPLATIGYQRLPQLQPPPQRPPPRTSLRIKRSNSAPMVALTIAATIPTPR